MNDLYKRIKARREELGYSQDDLAKKLGYKSRSSINKIEKGENDIPQSKIKAFADALEVTPSELMGWANDDNKNNNTIKIKKNEKGFIDFNAEKISAAIIKAMNEIHAKEDKKAINEMKYEISNSILKDLSNKFLKGEVFIDENVINPKLELVKEKNEIQLLNNFRKLNTKGQHEASKRVEELTIINKYIKNIFKHNTQLATEADIYRQKVILQEEANRASYKIQESEALKKLNEIHDEIESSKKEHLILKAAHEIKGASEKDKQHDYDLMDDDNF